jgi:adenosine deaminase
MIDCRGISGMDAQQRVQRYAHVPDWLRGMPKTDLHCHLGGSMSIELILELADKYSIPLPAATPEGLREHVVFKNRQHKNLSAYLDCVKICESVLVKPEAFERAAYGVCKDFSEENGRIFELRFGPTNYIRPDLHPYEIMEATLHGLHRAAEDFNMHTGLIVCGIRTDLNATRMAIELAALYHKHGVVGFDLAGKEHGHRPELFKDMIIPVLQNFVKVTIHAGEEDSVGSIAEAIIHLNARRIGHGVPLHESTKLMEHMIDEEFAVEACVSSNVDTGAVSSYATHPFRMYLFDGLRISPNTDNRTVSDTTITNENIILMEHLGLTQSHIYTAARHAIKSAFMPKQEKKRYLVELYDYIMANPPGQEKELHENFPYLGKTIDMSQSHSLRSFG